MEAGLQSQPTTASKTIADLLPKSAAMYGDRVAQKHKVVEVRDRLPELRHVITMTDGAATTVEELRARGRERDMAELEQRYEAIKPEDPYTFIYTSGTTGPPKGCVLTHGNYRSILDSVNERDLFRGEDDLVYLFLPLAHAFALLIQLGRSEERRVGKECRSRGWQ